MTGVDPLWGFIRPALRTNRMNLRRILKVRFPLET
jgi:hypothetical protein